MHTLAYYKVADGDDGVLHYTEISTFDLKGYLPAKLLNMILSAEVEKEFRTLYNYMLEKFAPGKQ